MLKSWFNVALLNFLFAALLGGLMRYAFLDEVPWMNFRNIMYAHYHTAMLGWIYLGLYAIIISTFLNSFNPFRFRLVFWLTELSVVGMLISYAVWGYGLVSILSSSLHIILSYVFVIVLLRELRVSGDKSRISVLFLKTALFFQVLSTIGLVVVYFQILSSSSLSILYYASVQFFLHFQFNGWFTFALIAVFIKMLEDSNLIYDRKRWRIFYYLLAISCLLTYAIAVAWSSPLPLLFWINSIGVSLQLFAIIFFLWQLKGIFPALKLKKWYKTLLMIALSSFILKVFVQFAVVIPYLATIAYTIRNYVIGFIHLILLAWVTVFLLATAINKGWIKIEYKTVSYGLSILIIGIVASELYLFLQGTLLWASLGFLPFYHLTLFCLSMLMPIGISLIMFGQFSFFQSNEKKSAARTTNLA